MKAWPSKTQEKPPRVCDITHLLCSADNPPTSVWSIERLTYFLLYKEEEEKRNACQQGGQVLCGRNRAHSALPTWKKEVLLQDSACRVSWLLYRSADTQPVARWFTTHALATPSMVFLGLWSLNHLHQNHLGSLWKTQVSGLDLRCTES